MKKKKSSIPETKMNFEPKFIRFSNVQRDYLREVFRRTNNEFNAAVDAVFSEAGIKEKMDKEPQRYKLRQDMSGIDILEIPPGLDSSQKKENLDEKGKDEKNIEED